MIPDLLGLYLDGVIKETKVKRKLRCMIKIHDWDIIHVKHYEPFEIIKPVRGTPYYIQCNRCKKIMRCGKCNSSNIQWDYGKSCNTCGNSWGYWGGE